ncbi:MAG: alpha/beta hydrolase-fold protein [Candidatus Carbobacillus sp.]|nr:alpha/beta hydrolase-fold protein [Candidatus Carbobacillus sp.]
MSASSARTIFRQSIDSYFLKRTIDLRMFIPPHIEPSKQLKDGSYPLKDGRLPSYTKDHPPQEHSQPLDTNPESFPPYPIIYTQDGQYFFMYGRIATIAQSAIENGTLPPFYIVSVDIDLSKRQAWYHPDGAEHEAYRAFFIEELLPNVEKRLPLPDRGMRRVLAGDSLGGTVSYQLVLNRPDLFQGLIGLSTFFPEQLITTLKANAMRLRHLRLFEYVGKGEAGVETPLGTVDFIAQHRAVQAILTAHLPHARFVEREGVHTWGSWQKILPEALYAMFGAIHR